MKKMRKLLKLSPNELKVLKISLFASAFILSSATVAASLEVKNDGHSYHTAEYKFTLLGGVRG